MVSFYGWNRVDRFMGRLETRGFSGQGTPCSPKLHPNLRMSRTVTNALTSWQRVVRPGPVTLAGCGLEIFRQSSSPDGKARYQPATTD